MKIQKLSNALSYSCLCMFLPSQVSHMWQPVQPAVLRCGHLQALSSAITGFLPIHCSACILHTLRWDCLPTEIVAHNSKDELVASKSRVKRNKHKNNDSQESLVTKLGEETYPHSKGILQTHFPLSGFSHTLHCTEGAVEGGDVMTV